MIELEALKSVQFVVGRDGRPSAVQLDIETWESLLDFLEDKEDRDFVKGILSKLRDGPQAAQALRWDQIRDEWDQGD